MSMSLNSIVADVFDMDLDELAPELRLGADLQMDEQKSLELSGMIAEYFDNLSIDFDQLETLQDLFHQVIDVAFVGMSDALE